MRFSFLVTIVILTASMSVSACSNNGETCVADRDCCGYPSLYCDSDPPICVIG
ncbi:hypothetical protein K503DRAFT_777421 [Rhizopogon vinicolor AM-OR11-026]|uniref:Uncharacterized protein n=1 Tax=Rhizopogon vinicolor AM-OR11-026 TaxID=1314800 RepID=A0A1B7MG92_9AGAM|nr:hypothetical protein K503DRAFT_777421 [Rhizopogon vinicolor AM-OR11-026]